MLPVRAMLVLLLAAATAGPAEAWEPVGTRWTRITPDTVPEHLVHYATLDPEEARDMLARAEVPLLYERDEDLDLVPLGELRFRSLDGLARRERFVIARTELGAYGLWDGMKTHLGAPARIDDAAAPIQRILGLPTGSPGGRPDPSAPFDPVVVEMPGRLYVIRTLTLRIRDPLDPGRETSMARVVTGTPISLDAVLPDSRESYRMILTFQSGRGTPQPRILFLPVDGEGELDTDRDGVVVRVAVAGARVDPWTRELDDALQPVAVRLHLGDRDSLRAWMAALPAPDRALYAQPGSPSDPLLMGPRARRAPLGAGVEARVGAEGRFTALQPFDPTGRDPSIQPAFSGVDLQAWLGRLAVGASLSPDLAAAHLGLRAGSLRDTDCTVVALEVGLPPGSYQALRELDVSGVIRARRRTGATLLKRTIEVGSDLRVGTPGFDYRALAGLRIYAGRGLVVTPTAFGGFRFTLPDQRGQAVLGLALDTAWNRNVFMTPPTSAPDPQPHRPADPGGHETGPPARSAPGG